MGQTSSSSNTSSMSSNPCPHVNQLSVQKFKQLLNNKFANQENVLLHCESCYQQDNELKELASQASIGAIYADNLWLCMECGYTGCLGPACYATQTQSSLHSNLSIDDKTYDNHIVSHFHHHYQKGNNNCKHGLVVQCHDSHVFCMTCQLYVSTTLKQTLLLSFISIHLFIQSMYAYQVYPRELVGSSLYDRQLDPIVYQWLLKLGTYDNT